ncbi:MAG: S8 family serine peptidase [Phycisphaerales bacterium]
MRKSVALVGACGLALGLVASAMGSAEVQTNALQVIPPAQQGVASGGFVLKAPDGAILRESSRPILNARLMSMDHEDTRVAIWEELRGDGSLARMYSAAIADRPYSAPSEASNLIRMRTAEFDPTRGIASIPAELEATPENRVYLVQFATANLESYQVELAGLGAVSRRFMPDNAQVVEIPGDVVAEVADLPFVRSVTPYHPAYKIDEQILLDRFGWNAVAGVPAADQIGRMPAAQRELYNLLTLSREDGMQGAVARAVEDLGGQVVFHADNTELMTVELDAAQLAEVSRLGEVLFIDRWTPVSTDMDIVRETGGANFVADTYGFTGEGVRGEAMDGNVRATHMDFQSDPIQFHGGVGGSTGHGTPVFGIVFGDGLGNPSARGLAPDAHGIFSSYLSLGNRFSHTNSMINFPYYASFQTNSWGNSQTTQYTTISAEMDAILFAYDITLTQSQSNTGSQASRPQAWAKNIVSVGGINHYGNTIDADDCWCGNASRGPAEDGRIKPDLVLYYDNIFTVDDGNDSDYGSFCCTSAATPEVAGYIALFLQMWHEGFIPGYGASGSTVFASRPSSALVKAMMIHTAQQYSFSGAGDRDRFRQGWGRPSLLNLVDLADDMFIVDEDDETIAPLETKSWTFQSDGTGKAAVTLVYRDPAGSPSASIHRVNDLTLRVISPSSGIEFWGNNGMATSTTTVPGGSPDTINTVERVSLNINIPGTWTVEVIASEINSDGNPSTPGVLDARFALVVSGLGDPVTPGGCPGDIDGNNAVDSDDLGILLSAFGDSVAPGTSGDFDGDGDVDSEDLGTLLSGFGPCP